MMIQERRKNPVHECPLTEALAAIGGKWKVIIIYLLSERPMHFTALRSDITNMSQKVLTEQLRELIADGIVERTETGRIPAPVLYSLTEYGRSVLPIIENLKAWGRLHQERYY
jgi:DNA-binding HxlR family transcriptional regulator